MRLEYMLCLPLALAMAAPVLAGSYPGTGTVDFAGYKGCIVLENDSTRVILGPHCGGKVLAYSLGGKDAIPLYDKQFGYKYTPDGPTIDPYGGRLDIGPENVSPKHLDLWLGPWQAKIIGPRSAQMVSRVDRNCGIQLTRTFTLDEKTSHLQVTQVIHNRSEVTRRVCHWSRTFALGGGIAVVPIHPQSRFPRGYVTYGPGPVMNFSPAEHRNVRRRDGFLEIRGVPPFAKFGVDCYPGWLAYVMPNDVAFVKRFPVYPERAYGEMAAYTVSIYYTPAEEFKGQRLFPVDFTELEPIGPLETLTPGASASFTEDWWLLPYPMPHGTDLDLKALQTAVDEQAK